MSSSTSSSENESRPRSRIPWGAVWCVGFVLATELVFRTQPAGCTLQFNQTDYRERDTLDYTAVHLAIDHMPTPDVVVLGSSRGREGVQSPVLEAMLAESGLDVTVGNYSTGGGRPDSWLMIADRLVAAGKPPAVIVAIVDAADLRDASPNPDRFRVATLGMLGKDIARNGWPSEADMTETLANSWPFRIIEARTAARHMIVFRGSSDWETAQRENPVLGGDTWWARIHAERMKGRERPPRMMAPEHRIRMSLNGYRPRGHSIVSLRRMIRTFTAAGTRVVIVEPPVAPVIRDSEQVIDARAYVRGELGKMKGPCVLQWSAARIERKRFTVRQFRDPAHLNATGAKTFVGLIAPTVAEAFRTPACKP